jgi:hypothetical protein
MKTQRALVASTHVSLWSVAKRSLAILESIAFWVAIGLPAIYLPLGVVAGVTKLDATPVLFLIGFHVVVLAVGHRHLPPSAGSRPDNR